MCMYVCSLCMCVFWEVEMLHICKYSGPYKFHLLMFKFFFITPSCFLQLLNKIETKDKKKKRIKLRTKSLDMHMDNFETLRKGDINSDKGHLWMRGHWKVLERQEDQVSGAKNEGLTCHLFHLLCGITLHLHFRTLKVST